MRIAMTVLYQNHSYYYVFDESKGVRISAEASAELRIPNLNIPLCVTYKGAQVQAVKETTAEKITAPLDSFLVVDNDSELAIFCTKEINAQHSLPLPKDCELYFGRRKRTAGQDNQVVIRLPYISSAHFTLTRVGGKTTIVDTNSKNGVYVNGKRTLSASITDGDVISVFTVRIIYRDDCLHFENLDDQLELPLIQRHSTRKSASKKPCSPSDFRIVKSPRFTSHVLSEVINIEKPPQKQGTPQINWVNILLVPAISIALMLILVLAMGMSAVMLIMSGVMSAVSAIAAVVNYKKQKANFTKNSELIDTKYRAYLKKIAQTLETAKNEQLTSLLRAHPAPQECQAIAQTRSRQLWERSSEDTDFLAVRVGTGTIRAAVSAKYQQAQVVITESPLETEAKAIADQSLLIAHAPIVYDLAADKLLGIAGTRQDVLQISRNLVVSLATAHSYDEVKFVILASERELPAWDWVRWLPHCSDEQRKNRFIFTSLEDAEATLDTIAETLSRRESEKEDYRNSDRSGALPFYVFVAATSGILEKHLIKRYIFSESDIGCAAIFAYDRLNYLPKDCNTILEVKAGKGELYSRADSNRKTAFAVDMFGNDKADLFARAIAPLYIDLDTGAMDLPRSVTFLEGYGVARPEQLDIQKRWNEAKPYKSLSVPLAATAGGSAFHFDIHEKRHGVNGIVAGMPGSGKTEMVQSWLLSLAVNFSPRDVSFVLIDFKGTGMIAPFRNLPHLAGSISNLDQNIDRNLIAIQSEVHRREAIIDRYSSQSVKNINDLNKAYDKGLVPEKLPILLIVIDEYAEFKKVFPDFGVEIDSLTSKGRALGIFVVLMTQKPAGVVSAKSEDNIKFRWCLRVANYSASREMLGRPDAAKIDAPGRAFIKVGEDDVYEQVQSFWSGAPYDPDKQDARMSAALISGVSIDGKRTPYEKTAVKETRQGNEAEIDVVVQYITDYCAKKGIANAQKVWTDKLPERIALTEILKQGFNGTGWPETGTFAPVIGLLDAPAAQVQYPLALDFSKVGHTIVYGAPTTGKTTLLKTLAVSTAMTRKPDAVSIYIMDFGGWNLNVLKGLPHVGGIANDNDPEQIQKLTTLLMEILEERKNSFSTVGVGNIEAYRDATGKQIPDILLLVDNFGPIFKLYPDLDAFFVTLSGSGSNYGIYLVATATASNAVPIKISQNIKNALALQMIDKSDYTYIVGKTNSNLPEILGRGLSKGAPPLEFQTALPTPGSDDKVITEQIRKIAAAMDQCWKGARPEMIPVMPETITYGTIKTNDICLGLSSDKVRPIAFRFTEQHFLLISAAEPSERRNAIKLVCRQVKEKAGAKLCLFDVTRNSDAFLRSFSDSYISTAAEIDRFVEGLRPEMQKRHAEKQANSSAEFDPILIVVDDYAQFFSGVSNETMARLSAIVKIGAGLGLYLLVADDSYALASMVNKGDPVSMSMAKANYILILGGSLNDHGAIQTKTAYAQKGIVVKPEEGYFVCTGQPVRFKAMRGE